MLKRIQVYLGRALLFDADDVRRENGQTVTEYAVTLGVLIVGIAGVLVVLRTGINTFLNKAASALTGLIP
jgi:Flp pilus assembly pilin Flp